MPHKPNQVKSFFLLAIAQDSVWEMQKFEFVNNFSLALTISNKIPPLRSPSLYFAGLCLLKFSPPIHYTSSSQNSCDLKI